MSKVVGQPEKTSFLKWMIDKLTSPAVVWGLWVFDVLLLLAAMLFYPEIFDFLWSKVVFIAAAVKSVLLFLGLADKEKLLGPLAKFSAVLNKRGFRGCAMIFSVLLLIVVAFLLLNPPMIVVTTVSEAGGSQRTVTGKIELRSEAGLEQGPETLNDTNVFDHLKLFTRYTVMITPDTVRYEKDFRQVPVRWGIEPIQFQLKLRLYPVQFLLTPSDARLSFADSVAAAFGTSESGPSRPRWVSLPAGRYQYRLAAQNYTASSGAINIPEDIIRNPSHAIELSLTRKTVSPCVVADRGLGSTRKEIPGLVRVKMGGTIVLDSVPTGRAIRLDVGREYTVIATAVDPWDLSRRLYAGSLTKKVDGQMDTIRIKVFERPSR